MRTPLAFAIACALLGGCASVPDDDDDRVPRYGSLRDGLTQRDPIPYRLDGDYHRHLHDRDRDEGHHDQWR